MVSATTTLAAAVVLAAGVAGCGGQAPTPRPSSTLTAYAHHAGARDAFAGRVVRAGGRLANDRQRLQIDAHPAGGAGTRRLSLTVTSPPCRGQRHCLSLAGTLTGTLRPQPHRPDRGRSFGVRVSGALRPLARVAGTGVVTGTGNVRVGHESMVLTLIADNGRLDLVAHSRRVPGFTSL